MTGLPVDVNLAVGQATDNTDAIRRKLDMDALRARFGDVRTEKEKLRESCEGFEAIFMQKMWEQMRKTVPKEGYLHSKDEETYQSLFDVELSKKMASAGGIGLADMLYEQLSQQLEHTARATAPGALRKPLDMPPVNPAAVPPAEQQASGKDKKLTAENLYSDLEGEEQREPERDPLELALNDLRAAVETPVPPSETGAALRSEILDRVYAGNPPEEAFEPTSTLAAPENAAVKNSGFRGTSWHAAGNISASPKPITNLGRMKESRETDAVPESSKDPAADMDNAAWPHEGNILSGFGWEDIPGGGRRWNSGITISANPGDPVKAAMDGVIAFAGFREGYGDSVILEHSDGMRSYYGNVGLLENYSTGDHIPRGAQFASILANPSAQGENSSPLHFELKRGEMVLNPEAAIKNRLTIAGR